MVGRVAEVIGSDKERNMQKETGTHEESARPDITSLDVPMNFNWNNEESPLSPIPEHIPGEPLAAQVAGTDILSECLRDGLQGISGYPSIDEMMRYLHLLDEFGVRYATVGIYPGGADTLSATMKGLLARMRDEVPAIVPSVLSMCTEESLKWTVECREIHPDLESLVFMGSAPSRRLAQGWDLDFIRDKLDTFIRKTVDMGIPVIAGTEHTTQTSPEDVRAIIRTQVESGAYCIALADTIGIIRPLGTYRLVRFVRDELEAMGAPDVKLDWHGHRDTGNALGNAMMATAAGVDRIHVVSRGVGERSGNASLEEVVLNFAAIQQEAGLPVPWEMSQLLRLISFYQEMVGVTTPEHGVLGLRYSHTSSGIHTDAILKAHGLADRAREASNHVLEGRLREMARTVYSAVDPATVGGTQSVGVSPWSGQSAVKLAYLNSGRDPRELSSETIETILAHANRLGRELTTEELEECYAAAPRGA
jgi:isopropylmalate/homocitrate/citramalate synthase